MAQCEMWLFFNSGDPVGGKESITLMVTGNGIECPAVSSGSGGAVWSLQLSDGKSFF